MGPGLASAARERASTLLIRQGSGELPRAGFMAVVFSRKPTPGEHPVQTMHLHPGQRLAGAEGQMGGKRTLYTQMSRLWAVVGHCVSERHAEGP